MKKIISIILDPAHGVDVKGKASPDGKHKEYLWSRKISKDLEIVLKSLGYDVQWTTESDREIGLSNRKRMAENIQVPKGNVRFLLSNHNNAAGSDGNWHTATGVEIWTSKGRTLSDLFAEKLFEGLHNYFPNTDIIKYRYSGASDGYRCKEENFTVLTGNYYACLVEWLFQDNKEDVKMLEDPVINQKYVDAIVDGIEYINEYMVNKLNIKED